MIHIRFKKRKNTESTGSNNSKSNNSKFAHNFFVLNLNSQSDYRTTSTIKFLEKEPYKFCIILNPIPNLFPDMRTYVVKKDYYMTTYTLNDMTYIFVFYDFKYIIQDDELFANFLGWLFRILITHKIEHFFMVSETDPLIYSVKYSSKIAKFNDTINQYTSRMIFIVPNTKNQFSFDVVPYDTTHKYDHNRNCNCNCNCNYFLIGSAATTGSVDVDAELESYAAISLGDSFTVSAHNLPKLHFNNNILLNLIFKMQILKHLFDEHNKLLNSNEKFKLIDLSVKIIKNIFVCYQFLR